jgi:hypothetical protein
MSLMSVMRWLECVPSLGNSPRHLIYGIFLL